MEKQQIVRLCAMHEPWYGVEHPVAYRAQLRGARLLIRYEHDAG